MSGYRIVAQTLNVSDESNGFFLTIGGRVAEGRVAGGRVAEERVAENSSLSACYTHAKTVQAIYSLCGLVSAYSLRWLRLWPRRL